MTIYTWDNSRHKRMNLYSRYTYMSMHRRYMMLNNILKLYDGIMKTTTLYDDVHIHIRYLTIYSQI